MVEGVEEGYCWIKGVWGGSHDIRVRGWGLNPRHKVKGVGYVLKPLRE